MNLERLLVTFAVAACCASHGAESADLPKRKLGQWQIIITSDNPQTAPRIEDICLDAATDAMLYNFALGANSKLCAKNEWKDLGGGRFSTEAVCTIGKTQMTIHGQTTFTGNTAYREEVKTHYEPPLRGRSDAVSQREAKWTGVCASDMRPGDIFERPSAVAPAGMRINVNDMLKDAGR